MAAVLDASAVLAYLLREPGWETVEEQLGDAVMSVVNAEEVLTRLIRRGESPARARRILELLDLKLEPVSEAILWASLEFADRRYALSLGDRLCLATAQTLGREAWTADRHWATLDLPVPVRLCRA